ncbi:hypothetical protein COLO4_15997 [Corchorus olitorius]|uniref:Uncharacterized protein n=1 Tax=Corchorus olitorius TaxID=93759 RepID=A0A1R3JKK8_9ROSI|nr:hypothetical protein COLO4_15997 [Corchorus olitorius]
MASFLIYKVSSANLGTPTPSHGTWPGLQVIKTSSSF